MVALRRLIWRDYGGGQYRWTHSLLYTVEMRYLGQCFPVVTGGVVWGLDGLDDDEIHTVADRRTAKRQARVAARALLEAMEAGGCDGSRPAE